MKKSGTSNKFTVKRIKMEDFFSVENLAKSITNRKMDLNKENVFLLKCQEIKLNKQEPIHRGRSI